MDGQASKEGHPMVPRKTWFITGCSRGFGRIWTEAALQRGDQVVATARDVEKLNGLMSKFGEAVLLLPLDVTNRESVFSTIARAHAHFGRLDVVVNNAGYGLFGAVEEVSEEQARAQIETNVFGALWVTQAVLPFLREQRTGHILQVSSIAGIAAFPLLGLYHASKWALEGLSESLALEVAEFGIKVTLIEPGPYSTDWSGSSSVWAPSNPAYEKFREARNAGLKQGDPAGTARAILQVVDAENPPLRFFLGGMPVDVAKKVYTKRLATWSEWEGLSRSV